MFNKKDYFYAVYKERSFSKAAKKLFISQPSLSAMLSKEEKKIGQPIFDRSTYPIQLTPIGEEYIKCCEKLFLIEENFKEYLNDIEMLNIGHLSIGSNHVFLATVLPEIISKFYSKNKNIQLDIIDLDSDDLSSQLMEGSLDLVLDNNELNTDFFDTYILGKECLLIAVPKKFEINNRLNDCRFTYEDVVKNKHLSDDAATIDVSILEDLPFVLLQKGYDTRVRASKIFADNQISPKILFEMNQLAAVFSIISSGIGASFISDTLIKRSPTTSNLLYYYKIDHPLTMRQVYLQKKRNKYDTPAMKYFTQLIKENNPFSSY